MPMGPGPITRIDLRVGRFHCVHRVVGDAAWFGQGGMFVGQFFRRVMQDTLRDGDEAPHGSIDHCAVAFPG